MRELSTGGFDVNSDWSHGERFLELVDVLWSDSVVSRELNLAIAILLKEICGTIAVNTRVWIRRLKHKLVGHGVLVGWWKPPTIATVAIGHTINKLLFRKLEESSGLDGVSTFDRSDSRESPARSTVTLVLNNVHLACSNPVDRIVMWR